MPWFFGLLLIPIVVVLAVMAFRIIRGISTKVGDGRAEWTDEWDPFE